MSVDIASVLHDLRVYFVVVEVITLVLKTCLKGQLSGKTLLLLVDQISKHVGCLLEVSHISSCQSKDILVPDTQQISGH